MQTATELCPLYPRKRTCAVQLGMSAKGHKRTLGRSFDHFIGAGEKLCGNGEAEHLCGFEIDD
jgi:hypothetical protein